MKKIAVVVFAAAILTGSAAAQAHMAVVSEACGECSMPPGMEEYSAYEVLVETYFAIEMDSAQKVSAVFHRFVVRRYGQATTVIIDQIATEMSPYFNHIGPGPIVRITIVEEDGFVSKPYEWGLQEIVEFVYLLKYGRRGYQW